MEKVIANWQISVHRMTADGPRPLTWPQDNATPAEKCARQNRLLAEHEQARQQAQNWYLLSGGHWA